MSAIEKEVKQECQVINFPEPPKEEEVVEKIPKYTKNGKIKKTPNNTKENRDMVKPIKKEDIPTIVKYYKSKVDTARSVKNEMSARRDLSLFIMGINIGLRVSDLITLKWNDIYEKDWTFKSGKVIKPKKTRKSNRPNPSGKKQQDKHVLLKFNPDFKDSIEYYRQYCDKVENMNSYIFTGSVFEDGDYEGHISDAAIELSLKNMAKDVGIKYNICTHSLRKSFCRWRYDEAEDKGDVLVKLMDLLGHSSVKITKRYICISEEETEELFNSVSIGFDAIFD